MKTPYGLEKVTGKRTIVIPFNTLDDVVKHAQEQKLQWQPVADSMWGGYWTKGNTMFQVVRK